MTLAPLALIIGYLSVVLLVANRAQGSRALRPLLYVLLMATNIGIVLVIGLVRVRSTIAPDLKISQDAASLAFASSIGFGIAATALLFAPVRRRLVVLFPRKAVGGFDPESITQMTALIFCIYLLANTVLNFVLAGGLAGVAAQYKSDTLTEVLETLAIWIVIAGFGAGFLTRRSPSGIAERLGLRWPTIEELIIGALMGAALVVLEFVVGAIWQALTPPDIFQQQTQVSQLITDSVTTLMFALLIAGAAAIGEEIAFRGALQPVFGMWPTAIIFALIHIQYTLTPAVLLIVAVALALGWLRRHYNTTTSMIAHFVYDFTLIALSVYLNYFQNVLGASNR